MARSGNTLLGSLAAQLPFSTFIKLLDLKLGSEIVTYFVIFNKVAGLYGLLAVFYGGTFAQVALYLYSIASLLACAWGLRQIGEENAPKMLLYAHLYLFDHGISTLSTLYFGVQWYVYNPHDGRREAHSSAQKAIIDGHKNRLGESGESDEERARKALTVWNDERGFATAVLVLGWLVKVYFILILYSFAIHLRRGTFRQLLASQQAAKQAQQHPSMSRRPSQAGAGGNYAYSHLRNASTASTTVSNGGEVMWDPNEEEGLDDLGLGNRPRSKSASSRA